MAIQTAPAQKATPMTPTKARQAIELTLFVWPRDKRPMVGCRDIFRSQSVSRAAPVERREHYEAVTKLSV